MVAKDIVRDEFDRKYASRSYNEDERSSSSRDDLVEIAEVRLLLSCHYKPELTYAHYRQNMFDNLAALAPPTQVDMRDELDRYLSTDVEWVENVVQWWLEHRGMYPRLSRMALDYLTIPGKLYLFLKEFSFLNLFSNIS